MKTNHRSTRSNYDANTVIPNDILPRLTGAVANARDCPSISYLRKEIFSKFVSAETDSAELRRSRAIEKWLATEMKNAETNVRLEHTPWCFNILPGVPFGRFIRTFRSILEGIVGTPPDEFLKFGTFSGGATTSRSRVRSYPADKFVGRAHITEGALELWYRDYFLSSELLTGAPNQERLQPVIVPGNVMFTVPKNARIDRPACKEPDLNMFMQRSVGRFIETRLRSRAGIDLTDQSRNRELARLGSIDGSLATVDLTSASDSVTTGLIRLCLPDWLYDRIMALRSPITIIDGAQHVNAMVSSMGNGFTFELQTLIYYGIARTIAYYNGTRGVISVYGDDIIIPVGIYDDLQFVLGYFGFTLNPKKSFATGPFRESCGGHFYNGNDITPFYVKGPIIRLTDIIHVGNAIRRWSNNDNMPVLSSEFEELWFYIKSLVPPQFWGGRDLGSKEALVTPDEPRKRLVGIKSRGKQPHFGDYVYFLSQRGLSSGRHKTLGRYRPGKNRALYCKIPLFDREI